MLLSFIIPAYNASNEIVRCLDSIYTLPLEEKDFEVIVIDDCSKDNTVQVIEQYATQRSNLTLIRQAENHRQGAARNRGMEIAKGDHMMFVDADDEVAAEGITNALNVIIENNIEICYFDFLYENPIGEWHTYTMSKSLKNVSIEAHDYLDKCYVFDHNAPWRAIISTRFLRKIGVKFIENVQFEDCDWTLKVYYAATKIHFVDGVGYKYHWGENATSRKTSSESMYQRIYSGVRLLQIAEEFSLPNFQQTCIEYVKYTSFGILRLRNLTKFSFQYVNDLLSKIDSCPVDIYLYIYVYASSMWQKQILAKHYLLAKVILFFACPIASIGRKIVNLKRKLL